MASELQYYASPSRTGATITAKVYATDGTVLQSGIACPEVGTEAVFIGDMPAAPRGIYAVRFYDGAIVIGHGRIAWDGSQEVNELNSSWSHILEDGKTFAEMMRVMFAVLCGKGGGRNGSFAYKSIDGAKTRLSSTTDQQGTRTAVIIDGSE